MRLIDTYTLELVDVGDEKVPYAILSHRWYQNGQEPSFQEFTAGPIAPATKNKKGYDKIVRSCNKARDEGFDYLWVDTCCINKMDIMELTESINSMFRWYQEAEVCLVAMPDVNGINTGSGSEFDKSIWFTRGWTLQELLAPRQVKFYNKEWEFIGRRDNLAIVISQITGIGVEYLVDTNLTIEGGRMAQLRNASVAQRFSWVSERATGKTEDMAYCLLGIFEVSMPLLYGEGSRAFIRLQEIIASTIPDASILAWNWTFPDKNDETKYSSLPLEALKHRSAVTSLCRSLIGLEHPWCARKQEFVDTDLVGFFAPEPVFFKDCGSVVTAGGLPSGWSLTNQSLHLVLPLSANARPYMILPCTLKDSLDFLALPLMPFEHAGQYARPRLPIIMVNPILWNRWPKEKVRLTTPHHPIMKKSGHGHEIQIRKIPPSIKLSGVHTGDQWMPPTRHFTTDVSIAGSIVALLRFEGSCDKDHELQVNVLVHHSSGGTYWKRDFSEQDRPAAFQVDAIAQDVEPAHQEHSWSWSSPILSLSHDPVALNCHFMDPLETVSFENNLKNRQWLPYPWSAQGLLGPVIERASHRTMSVSIDKTSYGNKSVFAIDIIEEPCQLHHWLPWKIRCHWVAKAQQWFSLLFEYHPALRLPWSFACLFSRCCFPLLYAIRPTRSIILMYHCLAALFGHMAGYILLKRSGDALESFRHDWDALPSLHLDLTTFQGLLSSWTVFGGTGLELYMTTMMIPFIIYTFLPLFSYIFPQSSSLIKYHRAGLSLFGLTLSWWTGLAVSSDAIFPLSLYLVVLTFTWPFLIGHYNRPDIFDFFLGVHLLGTLQHAFLLGLFGARMIPSWDALRQFL